MSRAGATSLPAAGQIPERAYFKIGEAAALVGVATSKLRHWESEIPALRPERSSSGHRVYARAQVERLVEVRRLLEERGLTLAGARRALGKRAPDTMADVLARIRAEAGALADLAVDPED